MTEYLHYKFLSAPPALDTIFTRYDDISVALGDQQMITCIQQYLNYDSVRCTLFMCYVLLWRYYSLGMMMSSVTLNNNTCRNRESVRAASSCASDLTLAKPLQ